MNVTVVRGDITNQTVEAVVTGGNEALRGGSGVNGAVHAAAGPRLLQALRPLAPCPAGSAVITPAYDLKPAKWIITAVGPRYGVPNDADLLMSAYWSAFARADEVGAKSIAFPSISTGVYGYPGGSAAVLSIEAIITARTAVEEVLMVAFSDDMAEMWDYCLHGG